MVEVLWQCSQVAASYSVTVTAATPTTSDTSAIASTTASTTTSSSATSSIFSVSNVTSTSGGLAAGQTLPQIEGIHPNQGPIAGN